MRATPGLFVPADQGHAAGRDQGTEGRTADVTQRAKSWAQAAMPKSEAEG